MLLGAWPQASLCVRAGRRLGVLLLGAAEPPWTMRCPAMSCWLLQGPAPRLAVSWYALLGLPVNTAGAGVGLAWHGPRGPWRAVKIKHRRCAAGLIFSAASAPRPSENSRLGYLRYLSGAPRRHMSLPRHPRLEPAAHARWARACWCCGQVDARARVGLAAQARQDALVSIARWARARCPGGAFIGTCKVEKSWFNQFWMCTCGRGKGWKVSGHAPGARPSDTGRTSPGTSPHTGRGRARATPPCRPPSPPVGVLKPGSRLRRPHSA